MKAGDIIAILDDEQVRAREEQAHAALMQAEARARAARDQMACCRSSCAESQLQTDQSKVDAKAVCGRRKRTWPAPKAQLAQQEGVVRSGGLRQGCIPEARTDRRRIGTPGQSRRRRRRISRRRPLTAAERRVEAARGALTTAKANLANPGIREAQTADGAQADRTAADRRSQAPTALTDQARAQLSEAQANRRI